MPAPFAQQSIPSAAPRYHQGRKMFGGRYTLLRALGRGGMGEVWLAQDNELGVQRALKFAPPEVAADARSVAMLKREAIAGTSLAHPNIVRIFDFAHDPVEMESAVVMEVVEGKSLAELQAKRIEETGNGFFEPEEIEKWLHDACVALDYAHCEGRVHRDLKPQNLMVETATGRLKIMDFGISHRIGDSFSQLTGKDSSGTLPYMSPQQVMGERPHSSDDIYGLGATLYDLLSGSPPFIGGALELQVREKAPIPIHRRRAEVNQQTGNPVPPVWEVVVMACLDKLAEKRPANANNIILSFNSPIAVKPPAVIERVFTPERIKPLCTRPAAPSRLWPTLTLLLLLIAVGWAWTVLFPNQHLVNPSVTDQQDIDAANETTVKEAAANLQTEILQGKLREEEKKRLAAEAAVKLIQEDVARGQAAIPTPDPQIQPEQTMHSPEPMVAPSQGISSRSDLATPAAISYAAMAGNWKIIEKVPASTTETPYDIEWAYNAEINGNRIILVGKKTRVAGKLPTKGELKATSTLSLSLQGRFGEGWLEEVNHRGEKLTGSIRITLSQNSLSLLGTMTTQLPTITQTTEIVGTKQ